MVSVCRCRCRRAVVNGSLDPAARAIAQHAFLFHLAIQGAAQKLALQRQMNRASPWQDFWRSHAPQGASL